MMQMRFHWSPVPVWSSSSAVCMLRRNQCLLRGQTLWELCLGHDGALKAAIGPALRQPIA
jgi:hypothetical protein